MPVRIRMKRQGAKGEPQYMIVAVDSKKRRDGAYLAKIGYYFPKKKIVKDKVQINVPVLKEWLAKGAQPSETVGQLIKPFTK